MYLEPRIQQFGEGSSHYLLNIMKFKLFIENHEEHLLNIMNNEENVLSWRAPISKMVALYFYLFVPCTV